MSPPHCGKAFLIAVHGSMGTGGSIRVSLSFLLRPSSFHSCIMLLNSVTSHPFEMCKPSQSFLCFYVDICYWTFIISLIFRFLIFVYWFPCRPPPKTRHCNQKCVCLMSAYCPGICTIQHDTSYQWSENNFWVDKPFI